MHHARNMPLSKLQERLSRGTRDLFEQSRQDVPGESNP